MHEFLTYVVVGALAGLAVGLASGRPVLWCVAGGAMGVVSYYSERSR